MPSNLGALVGTVLLVTAITLLPQFDFLCSRLWAALVLLKFRPLVGLILRCGGGAALLVFAPDDDFFLNRTRGGGFGSAAGSSDFLR